MSLIGLLVVLIVAALVYWGILRILAAFGIGDPIATVVQVAFVIIVVLYLASAFVGGGRFRLT